MLTNIWNIKIGDGDIPWVVDKLGELLENYQNLVLELRVVKGKVEESEERKIEWSKDNNVVRFFFKLSVLCEMAKQASVFLDKIQNQRFVILCTCESDTSASNLSRSYQRI